MQAILERFEGQFAVLRFSAQGGSAAGGEGSSAVLRADGQELIVPREELPKGVKEGATLFLIFSQSKTEEEHREKLAKSILNEILNNEV